MGTSYAYSSGTSVPGHSDKGRPYNWMRDELQHWLVLHAPMTSYSLTGDQSEAGKRGMEIAMIGAANGSWRGCHHGCNVQLIT